MTVSGGHANRFDKCTESLVLLNRTTYSKCHVLCPVGVCCMQPVAIPFASDSCLLPGTVVAARLAAVAAVERRPPGHGGGGTGAGARKIRGRC